MHQELLNGQDAYKSYLFELVAKVRILETYVRMTKNDVSTHYQFIKITISSVFHFLLCFERRKAYFCIKTKKMYS